MAHQNHMPDFSLYQLYIAFVPLNMLWNAANNLLFLTYRQLIEETSLDISSKNIFSQNMCFFDQS